MKRLIPLLVLVSILIAGCGGGAITIGVPGAQPSILSFNAEPSTISAGGTSNLSWNVTGATTITIDQGIGNVALTGTRAVSPAATTVYTLTASSSSGTSTATTQVVVSGASPTPTIPTPIPTGLPVINYFAASPSIITAGSSTTLNWSVSNATSVTIDNGVGSVAPSGSTVVLPPYSINYTLTALNAVGLSYVTTTVLVGSAVPSGMPDLVITDITNSSGTINYTIMNQGDATAGPSTTTLQVDGATVANDNVGSLAPGQSKTESFAGYAYSCTGTGDTLIATADTGNNVVESSEANNAFTKSWSCFILTVPITPLFVLKPDLTITTGSPTATPSNVAAGGHVTLSGYTIKNIGSLAAGSFSNGFYLSTNSVITSSDKLLDYNSNSGLAAGAEFNWGGPTLTIPASTPPGTYYIGILVDRNNAVTESDEGNNYVSRQITVH